MKELLSFLELQKVLTLSVCYDNQPWCANVYFIIENDGLIYFISSENTKHSEIILRNNLVAFSSVWFDSSNHKNRKAIQGIGNCEIIYNEEKIKQVVMKHNKNFPEFCERINFESLRNNSNGRRVWLIKPTSVKYWDDELYGENGTKEFLFNT